MELCGVCGVRLDEGEEHDLSQHDVTGEGGVQMPGRDGSRRWRITREFYDATVIADVAAAVALANSGFIAIYSGAQPALNGVLTGTQLAEATFGATAFGAPAAAAGTVHRGRQRDHVRDDRELGDRRVLRDPQER